MIKRQPAVTGKQGRNPSGLSQMGAQSVALITDRASLSLAVEFQGLSLLGETAGELTPLVNGILARCVIAGDA